ncbi:hypothetical protein Droror1_Dr00002489 [Drosera rotundifolia]
MPPSPATTTTALTPTPTTDICQHLLARYSTSPTPHHRHLCATAAALRSIITSHSLPLTPLSYFAAAITSLSNNLDDVESVSALATLLGIVVGEIGEGEIGMEKAAEAVGIVVGVMERGMGGETGLVKCLGGLIGFCDLEDFGKVRVGVECLVKFSVDKRLKVRKCALVCLEKCFKSFKCPSVKKKATKLVSSLLSNHMSQVTKLQSDKSTGERLLVTEQSEFVHALNVVKLTVPHFSSKISVGIVSELLKILGSRSVLNRPVLHIIQSFLESFKAEVTSQVAEDIIVTLSPLVAEKIPTDSAFSAAQLLKSALFLLDTSKWNERFLLVTITPIAGLLSNEDDTAAKASGVLKDLISNLIERFRSDRHGTQTINFDIVKDRESNAVASVCSVFERLLESFDGVPNVHVLDTISALFIYFGDTFFSYMKKIVLNLAEFMVHIDGKKLDTVNVEKCVGCAVIAMGPENILSIVPISFHEENLTCSNAWLIPVLKKYMIGTSLQFFLEHIVPLSESFQKVSKEVKKSIIAQELQAYARGLWGLLPAICRYTTDIALKFDTLAKLFVTRLQKDSSTYEDISIALQELVRQNRCALQPDDCTSEFPMVIDNLSLTDSAVVKRKLQPHSKKSAARNLKAISCSSGALLPVLASKLFSSTPQNRAYLKEAIQWLASISDSSVKKKIISSSLKRFKLECVLGESGSSVSTDAAAEVESSNTSASNNSLKWCLMLELASLMVEGTDEDLISLIFKLAKHGLKGVDSTSLCQAYIVLGRILEEHPSFFSSQYDDLVDFVVDLKAPSDINSLRNRLVCLKILLVHGLKNISGAKNTKAFAIINEVILALKNPEEDFRKEAYDVLLQISSSLHEPSSNKPGKPFFNLVTMMVGYLSVSSPHITTGVVSALSLLVYKEPNLCSSVPELVPSVLALLQSKALEMIKAALGFVKVLVSSLLVRDLQEFLSDIVVGIIPWSSVSKHHFRSKVIVILEILIRKCGYPAVETLTPAKDKPLLKTVMQNSYGKRNPKEANSMNDDIQSGDSSASKGQKKWGRESSTTENGTSSHGNKRRKQRDRNDHLDKKDDLTARGRGIHNGVEAGTAPKAADGRKPLPPGNSNKRKRGRSWPAPSRHGNKDRDRRKFVHKSTEKAYRPAIVKRRRISRHQVKGKTATLAEYSMF